MTTTTATLVYVGTYTEKLFFVEGKGTGVSIFALDPERGALDLRSVGPAAISPAILALSPDRRFLYTVNECETLPGSDGGGVSAFAVDAATGGLEFLNRQPSLGTFPAYVAVDATGGLVAVANHESGSVACYPVLPNGGLGAASDFVQHVGSSVHPRHQRGPHVHSVNFDPSNRYLIACDKGADRIVVYRVDLANGKLLSTGRPTTMAPGSGPRHLAFHPSGRFAFVINELSSTLSAFAFDPETGALREAHALSTLPVGYSGFNMTADIHVHPSGRFVYGSNRGHDSLAIFAFDLEAEKLTALGHVPTGGAVPRAFGVDPTGRLLLAANQDSDTIVAFSVDPDTGSLTPTGAVTHVPTPVCVRFA